MSSSFDRLVADVKKDGYRGRAVTTEVVRRTNEKNTAAENAARDTEENR